MTDCNFTAESAAQVNAVFEFSQKAVAVSIKPS